MSPSTDVLVLGSEHWRIGVMPGIGASLAFGQISDGDGWTDLLRPTAEAARTDPMTCSCYVLAPWSNRVAGGVLRYEGRTWQLRKNEDQINAIHGTANEFAWQVVDKDSAHATLRFDSALVVGANFPWPFRVTVRYELDGKVFRVTTTLENTSDVAFPAGFGHHPYFQRTLAGPADEVRLQIPVEAAFKLHNCIPDGPAGPLTPRLDFREMRPLGTEFIDDNLTARVEGEPIRLFYPRSKREFHVTADPVFSSIILYVPQHESFFAVEPVTNANDGFALYDRGVPGSGVFVLQAGESKTASFQIEAM
ncbi:MAG: hypothetical protein LBM66_06735 [Bifidobacteriaceae bacterium]|jgi:aldose 1-epimerase|nr:hypothetical protein [Bifidobacteriaceae bacterium]